ncbi:MAG: sugar phosphate isomerase/epimerase and 4-hydroxyphenylpyruvate domain-containing protein, partial [Gammaproteobacteria bacterium]|nr:sugar phosphate isomerase/epimerase and 4-hydroxyphenylpyruvate domain-containing protein [Gammaproteobacteria bacterium]
MSSSGCHAYSGIRDDMRLSTAISLGAGDLLTRLETIAAAGFTDIELSENDLMGFGGTPEEIRKYAASLGLDIDVFRYTHKFDCSSGQDSKKAIARLEHQLDLNQALGATTLVVAMAMSTHSNRVCNHAAICDELADLTERVDSRNQRAALIALPWASQYQTEMKVLELVETINHSALGLALSSYYSLSYGLQPAQLRSIPGERLFHVQLSDGPVLDFDSSQLNSRFGMLPGQGDLPLVSFVRIIARLGYTGSWSLACASDKPLCEKHNYVTDGFRALVTLLDEAARFEPDMSAPIPDLPARVYPIGFEFIEFAVDDKSRSTLTENLESLCFRKERHHVSKSVQLWRQGAINILINSENKGFASEAFT